MTTRKNKEREYVNCKCVFCSYCVFKKYFCKLHHCSSIPVDLTCHKRDGLFDPFDVILSAVQHLDKIEQNKHWHTLIEMRRTNWTSHPEHSWTSQPQPPTFVNSHFVASIPQCFSVSLINSARPNVGAVAFNFSTSPIWRAARLPFCQGTATRSDKVGPFFRVGIYWFETQNSWRFLHFFSE